jgi:hypothetical protein
MKETVPVGSPPEVPLTIAMSVTSSLTDAGFAEEASVTEDDATEAAILVTKASPAPPATGCSGLAVGKFVEVVLPTT